VSPRRGRVRLLVDDERAPGSPAQGDAPSLFPTRPGEASSQSRVRVLAVSLLLAALVHVGALFFVRWERERAPLRETLVKIMHVAVGRDEAVATPPPVAPAPPPAVPKPARVGALRAPPPSPRASAAPAAEPSASTAPATSAPRADSAANATAPIARARVAAQPRYKTNPEPPYPVVARRRGQAGVVMLSVRVDAQGRAESVAVLASSGFAALDEAAVAAVKDWEFEPGRLGDEPVASQVEVPIRFELDRD